jgi:uncharacterized protein (DUF1697 family)
MDRLRALFEEMKFTGVATFIASGNIVFSCGEGDRGSVARRIERHLAAALGYEVDTFVRTRSEVAAVAAFQPFPLREMAHPANTVHVGFWKEAPDPGRGQRLPACRTSVDEFCVNGREFYWLCRIRTPESKVWGSPKMKALALPSATMRNLTSIRKLAAQFPGLP